MRAALVSTSLIAGLLAALASLPANAEAQAQAPTATAGDTASATRESPLIAYARDLRESQSEAHSQLKAASSATTNLRAANFEMSRHPPPRDEDCAHTLGAQRFAEQYAHLAMIQEELGNFDASIEANKSALACEPRVASYQASIASALLSLNHVAEARAAVERAHALDPDDIDFRNVRARIDFIQERWADAIARFRLEALDRAHYGQLADYSRCYLWLAQRRAGVRNPELPPRESKRKSPEGVEYDSTAWPLPILDTLRGSLSEADLVEMIRADGTTQARQWLTEALFYVGELKLAEGDVETARRHFATVVNLRVLNFLEYGMARAELAKMREH